MEAAAGNTHFTNMTEGKLWKQILMFSLPIFGASVLQQIYNMVDIWFVGHYVGANAIAAIGGATTSFILLNIALFNGFSTAITVLIGQTYGSGQKKKVIPIIQNAIIICLVLGIVLCGIIIWIAPVILRLCSVPQEVMDMAVVYLRIYFSGTIFVFLYNVGAGILRALGDSRHTLYILAMCCMINVVADWLFVGKLQMGVAGAAVATVIAQSLSAVVTLYLLVNKRSEFTFLLNTIRPDLAIQKTIIRLAVPCSVQSMFYSAANLIFQSVINSYGTAAVASVSIYNKADMVCWWAAESFGIALTTIVAQNYGAGKQERVRQSVRIGLMIAVITEIVFTVLFMGGAQWYFSFFTDEQAVIHAGVMITRKIAPFFVTYVFLQIFGGAIKGTGKTVAPMIITFLGICVLRIVWVLSVHLIKPDNFLLVLYNYPVTWITTSTVFVIYYLINVRREVRAGQKCCM